MKAKTVYCRWCCKPVPVRGYKKHVNEHAQRQLARLGLTDPRPKRPKTLCEIFREADAS